ncbi:MAG: heme ABC exporter ATP-binding protein CcmA [Xanthobacteraceae bacterium]
MSAEDICIDRAGRRVVDRANFSLEAGEALIVTGPNGAGKSTLLRALAGLLPIAEGTLSFNGPSGTEPGTPLSELAHYLGHADALKGALTTAENLSFWTAMLGLGAGAAAVDSALGQLALAHTSDLSARYLSAGQRRRAALARLLSCERPVWLLDEPVNALDRAAQARLIEMFGHHLRRGGMIVAATHAPLDIGPVHELALGQSR